MIKVTNEVRAYEVDGKVQGIDFTVVTVTSHWNREAFAVLTFPGGQSFTVSRLDLEAALRNAGNTGSR